MRRYTRKQYDDRELNSNIVPFIDIIFCILIVFMVPNQMPFGNMDIELPPANAKVVVLEKDPIKVIIQQNGDIFVNGGGIKSNELIKAVNEVAMKDKNIKIYVIADKRNNYGAVLSVVGKLNESGYRDVVLISDLHNRL